MRLVQSLKALATHLGISKPAVSQHLRTLRKAGLVKGEKRGCRTHYMVDRQAIARIAPELNELGAKPKSYETVCPQTNQTLRRLICVGIVVSSPINCRKTRKTAARSSSASAMARPRNIPAPKKTVLLKTNKHICPLRPCPF